MAAAGIADSTQIAGLAQAADAFRNVRAVASLLITSLLGVFVIGTGWMTGSPAVIGLATLLAVLTVMVGVSAAGVHLLGQVLGVGKRTLTLGFFEGGFAVLKIIVLMLFFILLLVAFSIPVALVLLICKIPFIGPIFYAFVVPLATIGGALFYAGLFVAWQLLGPAIWEGNTIVGSLARLAAIARQRAVAVIVNLVLLGLLMLIAGVALVAALGAGYSLMMGLSSSILGSEIGPGGLAGAAMSIMAGASPSGHTTALAIGTAMVAALALSIVTCPALMGLNIIYVNASAGIDAAAMEGRLTSGLQQARARASQIQDVARRRAEEMQQRGREAAAQRSASPSYQPEAVGPVVDGHGRQPIGSRADRTCSSCGAANAAAAARCLSCNAHLAAGTP